MWVILVVKDWHRIAMVSLRSVSLSISRASSTLDLDLALILFRFVTPCSCGTRKVREGPEQTLLYSANLHLIGGDYVS